MIKTKGTIEAEISKAITQWEKEYLGRGSVNVKSDILRKMIVVNLKGILTPAEYSMCNSNEGKLTIKKMRSELVESGTKTGERVMVFKLKLANDYEKEL